MIRAYQHEDAQSVMALWQRIFGDSEDYIRCFLEQLPKLGAGAVAWENGAAAMAFVLVTEQPKIGYLYAVATAPEYRNRGLGEAVCRKAAALAGTQLLCTLPAEEALVQWYDRMLDLPLRICMSESEIPAMPGKSFHRIHAAGYRAFREAARTETVRFSDGWYRVLEALCVSCGGGLFQSDDTVLAAYPEGSAWVIHDWAGSEPENAAAFLAYQMGAERAILRVPNPKGNIVLCASARAFEKETWFGLTLD